MSEKEKLNRIGTPLHPSAEQSHDVKLKDSQTHHKSVAFKRTTSSISKQQVKDIVAEFTTSLTSLPIEVASSSVGQGTSIEPNTKLPASALQVIKPRKQKDSTGSSSDANNKSSTHHIKRPLQLNFYDCISPLSNHHDDQKQKLPESSPQKQERNRQHHNNKQTSQKLSNLRGPVRRPEVGLLRRLGFLDSSNGAIVQDEKDHIGEKNHKLISANPELHNFCKAKQLRRNDRKHSDTGDKLLLVDDQDLCLEQRNEYQKDCKTFSESETSVSEVNKPTWELESLSTAAFLSSDSKVTVRKGTKLFVSNPNRNLHSTPVSKQPTSAIIAHIADSIINTQNENFECSSNTACSMEEKDQDIDAFSILSHFDVDKGSIFSNTNTDVDDFGNNSSSELCTNSFSEVHFSEGDILHEDYEQNMTNKFRNGAPKDQNGQEEGTAKENNGTAKFIEQKKASSNVQQLKEKAEQMCKTVISREHGGKKSNYLTQFDEKMSNLNSTVGSVSENETTFIRHHCTPSKDLITSFERDCLIHDESVLTSSDLVRNSECISSSICNQISVGLPDVSSSDQNEHQPKILHDTTEIETILQLCGQNQPCQFSDAFGGDDVLSLCIKVGEGSYGEVFALSLQSSRNELMLNFPSRQLSVVHDTDKRGIAFKVVPVDGAVEINGGLPMQSSAALPEITCSLYVSATSAGLHSWDIHDSPSLIVQLPTFIQTYSLTLCHGQYPTRLLDAWDEYLANGQCLRVSQIV